MKYKKSHGLSVTAMAVAAFLAAGAAVAKADFVSITPTLDTPLKSANTGSDVTSTTLAERSASSTDNNRSLIRFTLPANITGATINSVKLTLTEDSQGHNSAKNTLISGLTESFDTWDSAITYPSSADSTTGNVEYVGNNTPSTAATPGPTNNYGFVTGAITGVLNTGGAGPWGTETVNSATKPGNSVDFGLTPGAFSTFIGSDTNGSITLVLLGSATVTVESMDNTFGSQFSPTLTIDYTPGTTGTPEPASLGILATAGVALLARRKRI